MLHAELSYDPVVLLLGIYPREIKTCLHGNLYMSVYSSITPNSQKVETTSMSIN